MTNKHTPAFLIVEIILKTGDDLFNDMIKRQISHSSDFVLTKAMARILKRFKPSQKETDELTEILINKSSGHFNPRSELLFTAIKIAGSGASPKTLNKLLQAILERGWYYHLEDVCKFLKRNPTKKEIGKLIGHYCDSAVTSESTEEDLLKLAAKYLPPKDVLNFCKQIKIRDKEVESSAI